MTGRAALHQILEEGALASRAGALLQRGFMALTVISTAALIVLIDGSGLPALRALAYLVEALALACFVAEYAARLWTAVEDPRHRGLPRGAARLRHVLSVPILVDLAVILLMAAHLAGLPHAAAYGALSLLRLLKLTRYSLTLRGIADTLAASRQILWASLVVVAATGVIFGCVIFLAERQGQPEVFGSLGGSIWWAVATLAGSAKADDAPESPLGQAVAMALNLFGFMIVALPMGIISGIFYARSQERQFVVTLSMVARVPFFQVLEPARVAEIVDRLRAESFAAGPDHHPQGRDRRPHVLRAERRGGGRGTDRAHPAAARRVLRRARLSAQRTPLGDGEGRDGREDARADGHGPAGPAGRPPAADDGAVGGDRAEGSEPKPANVNATERTAYA